MQKPGQVGVAAIIAPSEANLAASMLIVHSSLPRCTVHVPVYGTTHVCVWYMYLCMVQRMCVYGTPPFDPIDLLLKVVQCLECTLWVSETYHTTEVNTAQRGLRTG